MNKLKKATIALCLSMALLLGSSMSAFAAEPTATSSAAVSTDVGASTHNNFQNGVAINSSKWTTIATSSSGFNCNVYIYSLNAYPAATTHVRMLGKSGNSLWAENNAIGYQSSRIFWCGPDVYTIQVRTSAGGSSVYCHQA